MEKYLDCPLRPQDGRRLLTQNAPPVALQRARCALHGGCDLLRLVSEGGCVQLERWLDQCDQLRGWGQHPLVDLADGISDGRPASSRAWVNPPAAAPRSRAAAPAALIPKAARA
jgi:hypothetical protein